MTSTSYSESITDILTHSSEGEVRGAGLIVRRQT